MDQVKGSGVWGVVPTRNRREWLNACVHCALNSPVDVLLIVDDASEDDTAQSIAAIGNPRVRLLHEPQSVGCAGALHDGIASALAGGAEYVWVLDDDMLPVPEAVNRLLSCANEYHADVVLPGLRWCPAGLGPAEAVALVETSHADFPLEQLSGHFTGCLLRCSLLARVGLPNRKFRNGYEDVEYRMRLRRKGARVARCQHVTCIHREPRHLEVSLFGRRYTREVQPRWRLFTTTRNIFYTHIRYHDISGFLLAIRRHWLGVCIWAARLYADKAWTARIQATSGMLAGLTLGLIGALENPLDSLHPKNTATGAPN